MSSSSIQCAGRPTAGTVTPTGTDQFHDRLSWPAAPGQWYPVTVDHVAAAGGHLLPVSVHSSDLGAPLLVDDCTLTG